MLSKKDLEAEIANLKRQIAKAHEDAILTEAVSAQANSRARMQVREAETKRDEWQDQRDRALAELNRTYGWIDCKLDQAPGEGDPPTKRDAFGNRN